MPGVFDHYFQQLGTSSKKELNLIKLSPAYKVFSYDSELTITGDLKKDCQTFERLEPGAGESLENLRRKESTNLCFVT
jgi:phytoene dehydrogenase-like protein